MNAEFGYPTQENYEEKEKLSISPLAVSIVNRHFKVGEEALQAFNEISKGNIEKPSGALLFYQKSLLQISTESIIRGKPLSIPEKMDHLRDLDFKAISDEINNGSSPEITTPEETALMFDEFSKTLFNMPGLISSSMLAEDKMPEMIRNAKTIATNVNVPVNAVYDDDKLFSRLVCMSYTPIEYIEIEQNIFNKIINEEVIKQLLIASLKSTISLLTSDEVLNREINKLNNDKELAKEIKEEVNNNRFAYNLVIYKFVKKYWGDSVAEKLIHKLSF